MTIKKNAIPSLLLWIFLAGVAYLVVAKVTKEVGNQVNSVFK